MTELVDIHLECLLPKSSPWNLSMCLLIVFQQCDFDFAGNWHAEAVEEYEEEEEV